MLVWKYYLAVLCCCICINAKSQLPTNHDKINVEYLQCLISKCAKINEKVNRTSFSAIKKFEQTELRLQEKLSRRDSIHVGDPVKEVRDMFSNLSAKISGHSQPGYSPYLDTLLTSIKFLKLTSTTLSTNNEIEKALQAATRASDELKLSLAYAEDIKVFMAEQLKTLADRFSGGRMPKTLIKLNKQLYYYNGKLAEWKSVLKDRKSIERKALALLSESKDFQKFMSKNSQLASLFPGPQDSEGNLVISNGLQTRASVNKFLAEKFDKPNTGEIPAEMLQKINDGQSQLANLKDKVAKVVNGFTPSNTIEDFSPNTQKIKSFKQKLQPGFNIQSQKANGYFPSAADIGLSLGYKPHDRLVVLLGAAYNLGLGQGIQHIRFSHEGVGLRTDLEWKLKPQLWLVGGYEYNYRAAFKSIFELRQFNAWQPSGLVGLSRVFPVNNKLLKQAKVQLLLDLLCRQHVPQTQFLNFRFGYTF